MAQTTIDRLIINSPYTEPSRHWRYERETRTFSLAEGCRAAAGGDQGCFGAVRSVRVRVEQGG